MKLAILTPDRAEPTYASRCPARYEAYRHLFAKVGVETVAIPWTEANEVDADAVLPLLAWGYHLDVARWHAMLDAWPAGLPIINPVATLRWNTAKTYLADLSTRGAPVIPTRFAEKVTAAELAHAFADFAVDEVVVKPQISAGSHQTCRVRSDEAIGQQPANAMIQPFLPSVATEGELSLFFFGGALAHAVRKVATDGFRVQEQYGGRYDRFTPDRATRAVAEAVVAAVPVPLVYARVDMVRAPDGQLLVMEVEAIEPDLYLPLAIDGGRALADAVLAALNAG